MLYDVSKLEKVFSDECRERLQRARRALQGVDAEHDLGQGYACVHQEIDSLYGAARAVNSEEWQRYCGILSVLVSDLRAQLPVTEALKHRLLEEGISLPLQCAGDSARCLTDRYVEAKSLMQVIAGILAR